MTEPREPDFGNARTRRRAWPPLDIVIICLLAIVMAVLIGVGAGVIWLRLFGP